MKTCLSLAALTIATTLAGCAGSSDPNAVDFNSVRSNPTPEMLTLTERKVDVQRNYSVTANQNKRMILEDIGRFWMTDRPSGLTPSNLTSTSGKPR